MNDAVLTRGGVRMLRRPGLAPQKTLYRLANHVSFSAFVQCLVPGGTLRNAGALRPLHMDRLGSWRQDSERIHRDPRRNSCQICLIQQV